MTKLYRLSGDALVPVAGGRLSNEALIEAWLARQPDLLGLDILIIGRQVVTDFGGRIDLLGIDADGDLVIVELKRDRTPREIAAQVLDYASWVSALSTRQIHEVALDHLSRRLELALQERFEGTLPQTLNENHTMVIVASAFDAGLGPQKTVDLELMHPATNERAFVQVKSQADQSSFRDTPNALRRPTSMTECSLFGTPARLLRTTT